MTSEQLRDYLRFYQDLGFKTLYRRGEVSVAAEPIPPPPLEFAMPPSLPKLPPAPPPQLLPVLPSLAPDGDTMDRIREDLGDCQRCRLSKGRNKIVFGSGNESSPLVFVGEGPGADEDASGLPFVGRAGQLLTQMIEGTSAKEGIPLKRADVYICNVVKCRPPENRTPEADEMEVCGQFLFRFRHIEWRAINFGKGRDPKDQCAHGLDDDEPHPLLCIDDIQQIHRICHHNGNRNG